MEAIHKNPALSGSANLRNYSWERAHFTWAESRRDLVGLPGGAGLNIGYEAVDRHARGARANHVALRCIDRAGGVRDLTYADLRRETNRFANVLRARGIERGDRVLARPTG